jgi:arylsulfatase A-like enzyme
LLDDLHSRGWAADDLMVIASWETVERAASRDAASVTVSAGRHGGASRERLRVSPWASAVLDGAAAIDPFPGRFDYRPDRYTAELALEVLKARAPRFMMIALGDPDEYAHRKDYRGYLQSLTAADLYLGRLLDTLEEQGGETLLLVTTDHGREHNLARHGRWHPESRFVWLAARGARLSARVPLARARYLRDIAPTLRGWLGLDDDRSPRAGAQLDELALTGFRAGREEQLAVRHGFIIERESSIEPSWR